MANDFERAIAKAKYTALPLARTKTGPTTIIGFTDGHFIIVRNEHSCLPDPPIAVTDDPSVDLLAFSREFDFDLKGLVGFVAKIFGIGQAKADLEAKSVRKATVQLGGLSHHTIETGAFIDYLVSMKPTASCLRSILDKDNLTLVAALKANSFTYTFENSAGATVKFTGPEANGLFQASASVDVQVASDGKIVVTSPTYVGYVAWDGKRIAKEIEKAKAPARLGIAGAKKPVTVLLPFAKASASTITLVEKAVTPDEIRQRRLASMGVRPAT